MVARTFFTAAAAAVLAGTATALPTGQEAELTKRQNIDTTVLQFALTLEHLENFFYKQAIEKFSEADFMRAGYSADYYNNLRYIAYDEQTHVELLEGALQAAGVTPNQACTYSFPYNDVSSFITLSSVLEGVGTSAYLGGAPLITNKQYLTVAGSILAVEALHTSMQRGAIYEVPMANPLITSLDPTSVYTLAAMFITSCPASNMALPFTPFPSLQVDGKTCTSEEPNSRSPSQITKRWGGNGEGWPKTWQSGQNQCSPPKQNDTAMFTAAKDVPAGSYVTFVSGLSVVSVPGTINGMTVSAAIPTVAMGQTYVFVTKSNVEGTFDDTQVLFGPAVLEVSPPAPVLDFSEQ